MTLKKAARMMNLMSQSKRHAGAARYALLRRIGRQADMKLADELTQMTLPECREFVDRQVQAST